MFEVMKRLLGSVDAEYADIRYESLHETAIGFAGRELATMSANASDGFVVRVLKNGGLASVVFTREEEGGTALRTAAENAGLFAKHGARTVRLAPSPAAVETVLPRLVEDPATVTMDEKLALLGRYNDLALRHPAVATTSLGYGEVRRERHFASTEGSRIREDLVTVSVRGFITAKNGSLTQNIRVAAGGSDGFQTVRGLDRMIEERTKLAVDLLSAEPAPGGVCRCILNQSMTGLFTHEAFGHYSEADIVETVPAMRQRMSLGTALAGENLTITDDATVPGLLGHYRYDDEGVPVRPVPLVRKGVLVGRLHSRRTAAEFGEPLTGHCVAEDYRYAPIVRMGTIAIQPGTASFQDLLDITNDGLYVVDAKGGQTMGENFTFGANYGYRIRRGRVDRMVRDLNISGNLYQTLRDITGVGNDLEFTKTGGCGKGQTNIRSCYGGPHIAVNNLVVGGNLMEQLLEMARGACDQAEVYWAERVTDAATVQNGAVHDLTTKYLSGVSLRVIKNGRLGFAYTRNLRDRRQLLDNALNTLMGGVEATYRLPGGTPPPPLDTADPSVMEVTGEQLVSEAVRVSDRLRNGCDGEVSSSAGTFRGAVRIINSNGADLRLDTTSAHSFGHINIPGTGSGIYRVAHTKGFSPLPDALADEMLEIYGQGRAPAIPASGRMPVLFMPNSMEALLSRLFSGASARNVYEGVSPLAGKTGQAVFSANLSVIDDPLDDRFPGARPFDDEGMATAPLALVRQGVLNGFYADLNYSHKLGCPATGHGYRIDGEPVAIKPSPSLGNVFIEPGKASWQELVRGMERGILLEGAMGAHSGNIPNGDFSIGIGPGYYVEHGRIVGRVREAMIAGNIYQTLTAVAGVGDTIQPSFGGSWAPPILCEGLSVTIR